MEFPVQESLRDRQVVLPDAVRHAGMETPIIEVPSAADPESLHDVARLRVVARPVVVPAA